MTLKEKIKSLARIHEKLSKRAHQMIAKCYKKIEGTGDSDSDITEYLYDYEIHACKIYYEHYKELL